VWRATYGASGVQAQLPPEVVFINPNVVNGVFSVWPFSKLFINLKFRMIMGITKRKFKLSRFGVERGGMGWGRRDKQDKYI
jgi:hypothetical protein